MNRPLDRLADQAFDPRRNEALLRSDPARYMQMVGNVSEFGIYLIDRDGNIRNWNRGAAQLTGFDAADVVGRPFDALFPPESRDEGVPRKTLEFVRTNRHHRDEQKRARRAGAPFTAMATLDAIRGAQGELIGFVEVFCDVTEERVREQGLYQRATRDALTGVANRGHFTEVAASEIERARRFAEPLSVMMLDIDHFKRINDTYGHDVGDQAIIALARITNSALRKIDTLGRLGGEEFAVVLPRCNKEPAMETAQRLRLKLMENRMTCDKGEFGFTTSIGIAALRPHTRDLAELLRNADAALYKAKREGRNRVEVWFE